MKQYEYKTIKQKDEGEITETLNNLGEQGWEVVQIERYPGYGSDILFKRVKEKLTEKELFDENTKLEDLI